MAAESLTAILAAAGSGRRFGGAENKVFALIDDRPVLLWSLQALLDSPAIDDVIIVANARDRSRIEQLVEAEPRVLEVCEGGDERSDSVWNTLQHLPQDTGWVAVHDAARPVARPALIERVVAAARQHRAAVPALPITDTLKRSADGEQTLETADRRQFFTVQTPQVFERELLVSAYASARESGFAGTDDASYVEQLGTPVHLTPGDPDNLKITRPEDLDRAAQLLLEQQEQPPGNVIRTGMGYDVHQLVPGRPLLLGGVKFDHPVGLDGHSDADVLLHALCDALLGAAALGDIGEHYPNTDPRWKDASSLALLRDVARKVNRSGWAVVNVDVMLLSEAPKIRPYVGEMTANIAAALHVGIEQVNLKATTGEGMGFVGREEGMAAYAVATIRSAH